MLSSLFDIPLFIAGPAIIVILCVFAIDGLLLVNSTGLRESEVNAP
jgi:hypothetical protein